MRRVALVTAAAARHLDEDLAPLVAALAAAGAHGEVVVWDDPAVDWRSFDLVVVRSTWDYVPRRAEFLAWADRVAAATRLANAPAVLAWSTDKHYLRNLSAAGVPAVPTAFFEPGDAVVLPPVELVVKPAVGAGSVDAERHAGRTTARVHVERLLAAGRSVMVQPYLSEVDRHGETGLVFFGGRYSHAVRKGPILRPGGTEFVDGGLYAAEDLSAREPSEAERAVADACLDAVPAPRSSLLYARVDVVPGDDGRPVVLELELAEPSVFVDLAPGAAGRFAAAMLSWP